MHHKLRSLLWLLCGLGCGGNGEAVFWKMGGNTQLWACGVHSFRGPPSHFLLGKDCLCIIRKNLCHIWFEMYEKNYIGKMSKKNTAKRNMSSAVCASSMYSRLCMKMSSFLFVRACTVPRMLYLSCGIPFRFRHLLSF